MKLLNYLLTQYITIKGWILGTGYEQTNDLTVQFLTNIPGLKYPSYRRIGGQLQTAVGTAGFFNGTNGYATVPSYTALNGLNGTFEFWTRPNDISKAGTMLFRSSHINIRQSWGDLYIRVGNTGWDLSINKVLTNGGKYHIVIACSDYGDGVNVTPYINGRKYDTRAVYGAHLPTSNSNILNIGRSTSSGFYNGDIDEILFYNVELTNDQVLERYNKGNGTQSLPTGINEPTQLTLRFSDTVTNNATLGAGKDMTLSNVSLVNGIITSSGYGSSGIWGMMFSGSEMNEIPFYAQLPHSWVEGDPIKFHLHYGFLDDLGDANAKFSIEYSMASYGEPFLDTTVISGTLPILAANLNKHLIETIATLDMTGNTISTVINGRLFRDPSDVEDTYLGDVFVGFADFHIKNNTCGSVTEFTKW